MSFHFKNQITHPDHGVADKVNFFADFFEFTLLNYGRVGFPILENHKSLLEKIKFQLDNYTKHSQKYIRHYFQNSYLRERDNIISEYYDREWHGINKVKEELYVDFSDSLKRAHLNRELTLFIKRLDNTLFKNALKNIVSAILCKHPLEKHGHVQIFQYNTPILISEFVFAGFPIVDLQKLFSKLLAKEVKIKNNRLHTDTPLPKSVLKMKNRKNSEEDFNSAVSNYLKNRTLKQQFEVIYDFYKTSSKTKTYLFKVNNLIAKAPIMLEYDGVVISNQLQSNFITRKNTRKEYSEFFNDEGRLFAQVSVNESNIASGKINAIRKITHALNFLNATSGKEATIQQDDYIVCGDENVRYRNMTLGINPKDNGEFNEHNIFRILKRRDSLTKKLLLLDSIYFQAVNEKALESKIVHFWRYIESFFEAEDYQSETVRIAVSKILSLNSIPSLSLNYFRLAEQIMSPFNSGRIKLVRDNSGINKFLNITDAELQKLLHPKFISDINFKRISEIIHHPYVTEQIKLFSRSTKENKLQLSENFYLNILRETYEQRNFIEHSGISNKKAIDKLLLVLPDMIKEFRTLIILEMKKNKYEKFIDLLGKLQQKAILNVD